MTTDIPNFLKRQVEPGAAMGRIVPPPGTPGAAPSKRAKNTPVIDPQAVLLRIKLIVQEHGSVREVAEKCGLPTGSLETYVKGQNLPGTLAIASICHGLSVSADWLLFGEVPK